MRRVLLLAVTALLVLPATALAATRYASPGGAGAGSCAEVTPCSLGYAVTAATGGDEVVVTPGTYPVATTIEATVPLTIHGATGLPRPRIVGAKGVNPLKSGEKLTLSNLAIESTESATGTVFAFADGDVFDHLELIANGGGALALRPGVNWTMTDSLLLARGESAVGFFVQGVANGTATVRNDTVIAEGKESIAVAINGVTPVTPTIQATDVIAIAEIAAETKDNVGSMTSIAFDHSDLQGKVVGRVTQTAAPAAPPKFVDAAAGNYHQASDSPTIDAGVNDPADGATDLDGNPRSLPGFLTCGPEPPAITDIGAFEFVPVAPPCVPATPPPAPQTALGKVKIKGRTAKFRFRASGQVATGFECRLDRKQWRRCSSPRTYRHLKTGRHAFRVRAVGAGGADATPALRKFRIARVSRRAQTHAHRGTARGGPPPHRLR
jgi:hypothetical protein